MKFKKVIPAIAIALLGFNNSLAQNRIFLPPQQSTDYSKGATLNIFENTVPFEFQFLIDDNLPKVIANPAKSFLFDSLFASVALDRSYLNSFSFGLISPEKWILFADYSVASNFFESIRTDFENEVFIIEDPLLRDVSTFKREFTESRTNDLKDNFFEVRLLRAFKTKNSVYGAIGLFFGISDSESDRIDKSLNTRINISERFVNDTLRNINRNTDINQSLTTNKSIRSVIRSGLEFHLAKDEIETSQKLFLELRDFQSDNNGIFINRDSLVLEDLNFGSLNTNIFYEQNNRLTTTSTQPIGFFYSGYFNKKLNMFGDDFLFSKIDFGYNIGELAYINVNESVRIRTTNGISDTTLSDNNTNGRFRDDNSEAVKTRISLGYAITKTTNRNYLFTGLISDYSFGWVKDYSFSSNEFYKETDRVDRITVSAPIYLSVGLSEQVNIWGGGRIFYEYYSNNKKRDFKGFLDTNIVDPGREIDFSSEENSSRHFVDNENFIGLKVSLESGIDLNILFNSISNANNWAVNIGYNF